MRIGILTFSEADNYGAMLQAYALATIISKIGHECLIIRYRNQNIWKAYNYVGLKHRPSAKSFFKKNIELFLFRKRRVAFESFRQKLPITKTIIDPKTELNLYNIDKYIVGSDQVWNPRNTQNDTAYLLDFLKDDDKKIAYAASFGNVGFFEELYFFNTACLRLLLAWFGLEWQETWCWNGT